MAGKKKKKASGKKSKGTGKPTPKKRRVGRPKKRGRPRKRKSVKKVILKQNKGFAKSTYNRIRSLIWKNNKGDFKNYAQTAKIASAVLADCQFADCDDTTIQGFYEERRDQQRRLEQPVGAIPLPPEKPQGKFPNPPANQPKPIIYETLMNSPYEAEAKNMEAQLKGEGDFFEINFYWQIAELQGRESAGALLFSFPDYLHVISPMLLPAGASFQANKYDYYSTFYKWVQWANRGHANSGRKGQDAYAPFFMFSDSYWNTTEGRWEIEVFSVDYNGNADSFGFDPNTEDGGHMDLSGTTPEIPPTGGETILPEIPEVPEIISGEKPPAIDEEKIKREADEQRIRIERMKLEVEEKKTQVKKAEGERIQAQIEALRKQQKEVMANLREAKELDLGKDVMDSFKQELVEISKKIQELVKKIE